MLNARTKIYIFLFRYNSRVSCSLDTVNNMSSIASEVFTINSSFCNMKLVLLQARNSAGAVLTTTCTNTCNRKYSRTAEEKNGTKRRKRVVILGTGWAGYSFLKYFNRAQMDPIVVSPRNYFLFTPLLASTTVGTVEFRSVIEPIRNSKFRNAEDFHQAKAVGLDIGRRVLHCKSSDNPDNEYELEYDHLVVSVGAISNTFSVPGVEEHACFLKEISHAREIRQRILSNFERATQPGINTEEKARLLHTVIVGGGPTGIEFGAELYDFITQDVSRLYKNEEALVKVTLIEANQILPAFHTKLRSYAEKVINKRSNFKVLKSSVTAVQKDSITLKTGEKLPCGLVVWSTGLAPRPFVKNIDLPKSKLGQLLTDNHMAVEGTPKNEVFAVGDCSAIEGTPLPCTAQVAEQQGRYLANYLNDGTPDLYPDFKYKGRGLLAYIGDNRALADLPDFQLQGHTSWFLWRSAYFTRLASGRQRMQVLIDWSKTSVFGRDISRF